MSYSLYMLLFPIGLFLGMLLLLETGRQIGIRRIGKDSGEGQAGAGVIEGAVFGLLGLLIAFTFSGASSRFDERRHLIVQETNAIGTAYLRLDLLPVDTQPALREDFRQYLDTRLEVYRKLPDIATAKVELAKANQLQTEIWSHAVAASQAQGARPQAAMLLLPALNEMIDITTTRTMATQMHPPIVIFVMLFGLALSGALLAGYGMADTASRSWLHMFGFAVAVAFAVYVILDIEFPRMGLIRVDAFDQVLADLRKSMN